MTHRDVNAHIGAGYMATIDWEAAREYRRRHMVQSEAVITVADAEHAKAIVRAIEPRIAGRRVVEVGAGVGVLALEMAKVAESVVAIEAEPVWTWGFVRHLYEDKPANLTWVFGAAESVAEWLRADVAVMVTCSGLEAMRAVALRMAPEVIDVYGENA